MVFSSPIFLFLFFPLFFSAYFLSGSRYQNTIALVGSVFFYIWGAPSFVLILLASILSDWFIVNAINRFPKTSKLLLIVALTLNIGLLVYFKYANFFVENINLILKSLNFIINKIYTIFIKNIFSSYFLVWVIFIMFYFL